MWRLHQFPLCPFSRKVRLVLGEKDVGYELVRELPWDHRDEFVHLNPAGETPVMVDAARQVVLVDSTAIVEFLDETIEQRPVLPGTAVNRAEVRRLNSWFDHVFYADVTAPLLQERMHKRVIHRQPPDGGALRDAMRRANTHLDYIDYLIDHRTWLGGALLSLADLSAAAQISVADYLGGIDWSGHEQTRGWYSGLKSRPSFRPLLAERMEGVTPPAYYELVDF